MQDLKAQLIEEFGANNIVEAFGELTVTVTTADIIKSCLALRDLFFFDTLIDLCGVDYLTYGQSDWEADASSSGFGRGREACGGEDRHEKRFAVVYHLLSVSKNYRLRVKAFVDEAQPMIETVTGIWAAADWYEREAFDLMGILFENHTDLRRLLTDYGFVGHPLRKDFPMIGEVEMRYDEALGRVVYEPVSIEPNVNIPRVIRK
ncbi:NADH-ubiquinone oxidoreductase chain C [Bathymodiolus thermophilus thioautotrophic gill symbiont]|uniref:NADH-quinone oxidoreductase subunit C n=1 Tax=Bathymodiolus thermophilus thioautotrophic gill symbiont TaxID=2360 RepID=A0A1J5U5Z5_9GAMM|nr:NADH-quinone oxidoreductase subunit C [Bathymodiolus thermophilus thioautotrophic gill symbiont]AYQ56104.1 NADH-quinone oxidoreductase subunit C [Bathymodiolus thermophilus thioautotrophic gill symbiont]OIR24246.1 NADH-quinone oxidoreductase subunit C [Bathymodiolus thermophilus thioautotrophic gill symbiont]SHA00397.1 NADH-ubiquinone oxidoreductase chain C [Bathymodiolus thermophilus thioautotrophic gill symbiont]